MVRGGDVVTRVTSRIPAARGRVVGVSVMVRADDLPAGLAVDVTDVQLTPGAAAVGTVPHPSDVAVRLGQRQFRNGVVARANGYGSGLPDYEAIIALGDPDSASPTRVHVAASGEVRVGSFRFGRVDGHAIADGEAGTASQGWGRVPVVTERSDLTARVYNSAPTHVIVEWVDRL